MIIERKCDYCDKTDKCFKETLKWIPELLLKVYQLGNADAVIDAQTLTE